MATLAEVRNQVDAKLAELWPVLVARQNAFFAARGRYWHGAFSRNTTPADGNTLPSDTTASAGDGTYADLGVTLGSLPMRLWVSAYESPQGHGWSAEVEVQHNGRLYRRGRGVGPLAASLTYPWFQVRLAA